MNYQVTHYTQIMVIIISWTLTDYSIGTGFQAMIYGDLH